MRPTRRGSRHLTDQQRIELLERQVDELQEMLDRMERGLSAVLDMRGGRFRLRERAELSRF